MNKLKALLETALVMSNELELDSIEEQIEMILNELDDADLE